MELARPPPKTFCTRCAINVPPEHWSWQKDIRYLAGGRYQCREKKRELARNSVRRIKSDPVRRERKRVVELRWARENSLYIRYKQYIYVDRRNGRTDTIEKTAALSEMGKPCFYCKMNVAGGLDRKCSDGSHSAENVVPCCMRCNNILGDLPFEAKILLAPGLQAISEQGILKNYVIPQLRNRRKACS